MIIEAFDKTFEVSDRNWKWMTIDEDGTVTIFINDPNDEFEGEPVPDEGTFFGGYWSNPYGPGRCWHELTKTKAPKNWREELYHLDRFEVE